MTSGTGTVTIRSATMHDLDTIVRTLAIGFLDGDFAEYLIPHPDERARVYPVYFEILAEHALRYGLVDLADDGVGVALWYHYGQPIPPIPDYEQRLAAAVGNATPEFLAMDHAMEDRHPSAPHHYLSHLAVRPHRRNNGLGNALLRHHVGHMDLHQYPSYLEATGPANQRLYLKHGYQRLPAYRIGGAGPQVLPMWRDPVVD